MDIELKKLPIGVSSFAKIDSMYYVDKTLFIKDFIDLKGDVTLFTRPRRFGKTLNMDMLKTFFEKTPKDNSDLFKDKKIWQCGSRYTDEQGKYPVIWITFKSAKFATYDDCVNEIKWQISNEYARHNELSKSPKLTSTEKRFYKSIVSKTATKDDYIHALEKLSDFLYKHWDIPPIIMIDEYDTPVSNAYTQGY
ncbi:MAG: AAA family ATPase, partial [Prevotella sp.]|nr:AAA family ATPase [Prevotella sp.]